MTEIQKIANIRSCIHPNNKQALELLDQIHFGFSATNEVIIHKANIAFKNWILWYCTPPCDSMKIMILAIYLELNFYSVKNNVIDVLKHIQKLYI